MTYPEEFLFFLLDRNDRCANSSPPPATIWRINYTLRLLIRHRTWHLLSCINLLQLASDFNLLFHAKDTKRSCKWNSSEQIVSLSLSLLALRIIVRTSCVNKQNTLCSWKVSATDAFYECLVSRWPGKVSISTPVQSLPAWEIFKLAAIQVGDAEK